MLQKVNVVVFDFDGTLSASDSNFEFGKYCFKHSIRPWLFLPVIFVAQIGRILNPSGIWWRQTMRRFLTENMVKELSGKMIVEHKQRRFGWAKDQVAKEHRAGNKVVLISASTNYLIPKLVADMKFDAVFTSQMEQAKPWRYKFLCWGNNKVIALDNWAKENKYIPNVVRAYSDSKSDLPIMEIAKEQVWIDKKTGLRN
ncbi:MAG: haloacid dehalogenase-like hydrolase [Alphaproteobacteria bacterium]|nr:haloacid dehalogenase-like hydrolase [Alphaproteobacteria bacterium]